MKFYYYIWIQREGSGVEYYYISPVKESVPVGKIAARIDLTPGDRHALSETEDWMEYQKLLEHLFDNGQKIETSSIIKESL